MTRQKPEKLKNLMKDVPPGFLVDTPWLGSRSIDRKLAHWYVKSGWLNRVAQGVYQRPGVARETDQKRVTWLAIVASIDCLMGYDVHVGGKTALSAQGYQHYLNFGQKDPVYLYGDGPRWLNRVPSDRTFRMKSRAMFRQSESGIVSTSDLSGLNEQFSFFGLSDEKWAIRVSLPERAILEMLAELPSRESFELTNKIFEGLYSLRPDLVQELLSICTSVKVKRYFMVFADRHNHSWWSHVKSMDVNLGSGPRQTFSGGRIHPKYKISVPKEYLDEQNGDYQDGP